MYWKKKKKKLPEVMLYELFFTRNTNLIWWYRINLELEFGFQNSLWIIVEGGVLQGIKYNFPVYKGSLLQSNNPCLHLNNSCLQSAVVDKKMNKSRTCGAIWKKKFFFFFIVCTCSDIIAMMHPVLCWIIIFIHAVDCNEHCTVKGVVIL